MNIVNVVNFVRSADSRTPRQDMLDAVINQVRYALEYDMPTTFLLQPDAVTDEEYVNLIPRKENIEIGMWLELNRTLVTKAGGEWLAGDKEWWWYSGIDLPCGYSPELRRKMVDIAMADFKDTFGFYPKTVGSWVLDCVCLEYMEKKYGVTAALNCKDQWGTDSYTLWGGYINQAFYPTKINAFTPASKKENQINIPIFRMLGSDPVDQYDLDTSSDNGQTVCSLEPVYPEGGANREWVEWFFEQIISTPALCFGYAQTGQENAFGWSNMKNGFEIQMPYISELDKQGKIKLMTVSEASEWFRNKYEITPPATNIATKDGRNSIWFSNANYRLGFYADKNVTYIRDIQIFNDEYPERYLNDVCELRSSVYDNIPLVEGYLWSDCLSTKKAGLFFEKNGKRIGGGACVQYEECNDGDVIFRLTASVGDETIRIELCDNKFVVYTQCSLKWVYDAEKARASMMFRDGAIDISHNGFDTSVGVSGNVDSDARRIDPVDGKIEIMF